MASAAEVVLAVDGRVRDSPLLILPVGDALQEPFWPEGLGINRGVNNVLDSVWCVPLLSDILAARMSDALTARLPYLLTARLSDTLTA